MFARNITYEKTITMVTEICCNCGMAFGMPSDLREQLMNDPAKSFYCPNGHGQHYSKSKERRLREEAEQKLKQRENELANAAMEKIQLEAEIRKRDRKLKRVHQGTCPCCNRSFANLKRHMATKHADHTKQNEQRVS